MSRKIHLVKVPYNGIQPGEKVVFVVSSRLVRVRYGIYLGLNGFDPVVEYMAQKMVMNRETLKREWKDVPTKSYLKKGMVWKILDANPEVPENLLDTTDAVIWAKEFVRIKKEKNWTLDSIDEQLMISWFANAMFAQELKDQKTYKAAVAQPVGGNSLRS